MKRFRLCLTLLPGLFLASTLCAHGAEISGSVEVVGPARSVAALRVTLRKITSRVMPPSQEPLRTQPGADGRFAFSHVKPDWYVLEVGGPGVVSAQWGAQGPELAGRALVVRSGENVRGLRVQVVSRPVLCGRVFSIDGKPSEGARVSAWRMIDGGPSQSSADVDGITDGGNTMTDRLGRYRFETFHPGYYTVSADAPDQAFGMESAGTWKDAVDLASETWIDLSAHDVHDRCPYDITLRPLPKSYDGPRYRVEGALSSHLSTVIHGEYEWTLYSPERDQDSEMAIPFDPARPAFSFDRVRPGKYRLQLGPRPSSYEDGHCRPAPRSEVDEEIVVSADMLGLRVSAKPVAWVKGQVEKIQTAQDVGGSSDAAPWRVTLSTLYQCSLANVGNDGSFKFSDLDTGATTIEVSGLDDSSGAYISQFFVNGVSTSDALLHLAPGENTLKIVERFDSGSVDAVVYGRFVDGSQQRDQDGTWLGDDEHVLLLDEQGRRVNASDDVTNGEFKTYLRPGRYTVVAGMNKDLSWGWAIPNLQDARALKIMASLGTPFVVELGKTTTVTLRDRTVEIQNMSAALGFPMQRRY